MNPIPVIFVRKWTPQGGHFPGVPIALKCAKRYNERVILIGCDKQPPAVRQAAEFHPLEEYSKCRNELERIWPFYRLEDSWFLLQVMSEWLTVFEFCLNNHISFAAVFDTDVLCFDNMTEAAKPWLDCHYATCNAEGMPQGPSLVTLDALEGFSKFVIEMFRGTLKVEPSCYEESKCSMSAWRWYHNYIRV